MDNYELIHLEDYTQSGEGGTAVSYTHKNRNTLAKLYKPGFEADRARAEAVPIPSLFRKSLRLMLFFLFSI